MKTLIIGAAFALCLATPASARITCDTATEIQFHFLRLSELGSNLNPITAATIMLTRHCIDFRKSQFTFISETEGDYVKARDFWDTPKLPGSIDLWRHKGFLEP
jgi:hypothetical protein